MSELKNGFEIEAFLKNKRSFQKPSNPVNIYAGKATSSYSDSPHPDLHQLLRRQRDMICDETGLPVYRVANSKTLEELVLFLPQTYQELGQISGFGQIRIKQFGERFLSIISNFCEEHNIMGNMEIKPAKKEKKEKSSIVKTDTKLVSFTMYKEGKNVEEIAATRNMTADTIIGHLTYWIGSGDLNINELMTAKKQITIKQAIEKFGTESLKPIVENNSDAGVTYGDVRMVLASIKAPL
jgi:ATP-dependent DNA helicase RecQ